MATVTRVEFTDDIDGKALDIDDLNRVSWSWLGVDYEFETSTANLDRIEHGRVPLATLLATSRRVGGRKHRPSHTTTAPTRIAVVAGTDSTTIRQWARDNGYELGDRGRIPTHILTAFTDRSTP
ncbi:histone-like nucleoid-structuring protein Lsr2 [Williamsia soli]|uniref:histone-like nucleoid-structuring protein Lsr2 n=1 Tax=Williamsia soli TaxID=364929 RepID=UPI001A9CD3CF|nr:Lsr2 family protein [Williamsia soli]